jgi:hypothetical protein
MKCNRQQKDMTSLFVLRTDGWYLTKTTSAGGRGGAGSIDVSGSFMVDPEYRGCTACGNNSFVRCDRCGNITCSRFEDTYFSCPWCGDSGPISLGVNEIRAADGT